METERSTLLSAIPDLVLRLRADGTCLERAGGHCLLTPDMRLHQVLPSSVAANALEAIDQALASKVVQRFEYQLDVNGHRSFHSARIAASGADEVVVVVRDVTEERAQQDVLEQARAELEARVRERTEDLDRIHQSLTEQMERRGKAEVAVRESLRRLQLVMAESPVALIELDARGGILSWNVAAEQLFEWPADEVIGRMDPTVPPDWQMAWRGWLSAVRRGAVLRSIPQPRITKSGRTLVVDVSAAPLHTAEASRATVLMTAQGSRRDHSQEIQNLTERLAALNLVSSAVGASLDMNEVLAALPAAAQLTVSAPAGAIFLAPWTDGPLHFHSGWGVTDEDLEPLHIAACDVFLERKATRSGAPWKSIVPFALTTQRSHGGVFLIASREADAFPRESLEFLRSVVREVIVGIENADLFQDLKTANERLQLMSRRLVAVQEAERRHLGRELHDQIGQMLTGLKFLLNSSRSADGSLERTRVAEADGVVQSLLEQVRALSLELRPALLDDSGLVAALEVLIEQFGAQTGLDVRFHYASDLPRPDGEVETAAFRIVQEALTNAARHSGGDLVAVRLWTAGEQLFAAIEDNGRGFRISPEALGRTGGLSGMKERTTLAGGNFAVESDERGTRISVDFPMKGNHAVRSDRR